MSNNQKTHYAGRYLGMRERDGWEYTYRTNASGVVVLVPVTDNHELVLVEQYRIPVESAVLELPAGLVGDTGDKDEPLVLAARRELLEETGFQAEHLEELMTSPSSPGLTDEMITIYYASGLRRTGEGGGDDSEDITVHIVKLDEVAAWLETRKQAGLMVDPKIYSGLFWASQRT